MYPDPSIQGGKFLGSKNKLGTDDGNILGSTGGGVLGNTLGDGNRNTIGLVGRNDIGSSIVSSDNSVLLDGKEIRWYVGAKTPKHLPHSEQSFYLSYMFTP